MIWTVLYWIIAMGVSVCAVLRDWGRDGNRGMFQFTLGDLFIYVFMGTCWPLLLLANSLTIFDRILCIRLWTRK